MRPGETWVHDCAQDIALQVFLIMRDTSDSTIVRAHLVNRRNPNIYYETNTYTIRKEHRRFWHRST